MVSNRSEKPGLSARSRVTEALEKAFRELGQEIDREEIHLERPNDPSHGDVSCNIALVEAKKLGKKPRDFAAAVVERLSREDDFIDRIEVAGPGFINFSFSRKYLVDQVARINRLGGAYGDSNLGGGRKLQVEFVSANPTGPLVIVSARAAAVGAALVEILKKTGYAVETEYYLNDTGSQVKKLGESLLARFRQRLGEEVDFPEDGYPGDYLIDIAAQISPAQGRKWLEREPGEAATAFGTFALERIIAWIKKDLEDFGVRFDVYFHESGLHQEGGEVEQALRIFREKEVVYKEDGASWFRSSEFGDEKDRVLIRSDGTPTYFLADAAYHLNKLKRGFDHVVDIFGPDHHGHISRLQAAAAVMGAGPGWLDVLTVQWVRLIEEGKQIKMSKRGGEFETLADLVADVGADASKFFFLMRKTNAHLDFNLTLARKETDENPVYYVQYAHARISSVIEYACQEGVEFPGDMSCLELLGEPEELELMRNLVIFPQLLEGAALANEPHRLTTYTQQVAASFHRFYHICRIVSRDTGLSQARLLLVEATRIVLAESLRILGVSAPRKM
ncbi:MAG: arginine--tRNA ligase [Candidatus Krumholzibacteriota bacterium]|nr:arginine--tRNA ligase [Candidatus Krumholzibacteriota bacterium]